MRINVSIPQKDGVSISSQSDDLQNCKLGRNIVRFTMLTMLLDCNTIYFSNLEDVKRSQFLIRCSVRNSGDTPLAPSGRRIEEFIYLQVLVCLHPEGGLT